MAKLVTRLPRWVLLLGAGLIVVVLTPFLFTTRHQGTKRLICDQCGLREEIRSEGLAGSAAPVREQRTFQETELSRWFAVRLGTNCQHTWRFNHYAGERYLCLGGLHLWTIVGSHGSLATSSLVDLSAEDRIRLESLLQGSPEACRRFIRNNLRGRSDPDE